MGTFFNRYFKFFVSVSFLFFFCASTVFAAPLKGFEASVVTIPKADLVMEPGSTQIISLSFKNIGTTTWKKTGKSYVSLYTFAPKYRASIFRSDKWSDYTQAALLKETSVAPNKTGSLDLVLKAPIAEGDYKETFKLAAEDTTWIPGSEITIQVKVQKPKPKKTEPVPEAVVSPAPKSGLSAMLLLRSAKTVVAEAGQSVPYRIGIKNTGTVAWNAREIRASNVAIASVNSVNLAAATPTNVTMSSKDSVTPGALDLIDFTFNAPASKGLYTIRYQLAVDKVLIPDFFIDIPVEVTTGSGEALESPIVVSPNEIQSSQTILEPTLRIGVLIVDQETDWNVEISCNTAWKLIDGEGGLLGELEKNQMVRAFYKNQRYYFNRGKGIEQTHQYLRFVPNEKEAICKIENFDQRKTRRAAYPDNEFRDVLELRYNKAKDRTWVINELPIEEYLYGLGETSNISHPEFKKALIVTARTYGIYNWERATKHASEYFHMNNSGDDQVYKGYGYEVRNPNIRLATEETRGVTVNYQNATAITPYFSRSDGRTRDWSEVWGGSVPWAKSVSAPCDARKGRQLWGHGVGMSATEALCMAEEGGKNWKEILHYFYQGIDLQKRWE